MSRRVRERTTPAARQGKLMGIKLVRFISSERVRLILSFLVLHPSIHPLARCCRLLSSLDPNFRNKDQAFNVAEHAHWERK